MGGQFAGTGNRVTQLLAGGGENMADCRPGRETCVAHGEKDLRVTVQQTSPTLRMDSGTRHDDSLPSPFSFVTPTLPNLDNAFALANTKGNRPMPAQHRDAFFEVATPRRCWIEGK